LEAPALAQPARAAGYIDVLFVHAISRRPGAAALDALKSVKSEIVDIFLLVAQNAPRNAAGKRYIFRA
jgi:hypothetical protein